MAVTLSLCSTVLSGGGNHISRVFGILGPNRVPGILVNISNALAAQSMFVIK